MIFHKLFRFFFVIAEIITNFATQNKNPKQNETFSTYLNHIYVYGA